MTLLAAAPAFTAATVIKFLIGLLFVAGAVYVVFLLLALMKFPDTLQRIFSVIIGLALIAALLHYLNLF